ncbi:MAG: linear amide C-N hydrolase [Candidatus Aminicenantes bacterium]|nr:linear amide C-N hydrolase [Candidatus Aminicenantes bacterium]
MKKNLFRCFCLLWVVLAFAAPLAIPACSTFVLQKGDKLLFGRNFDFFTGNGAIMVNPRGLAKTALVLPGENPAKWTAQYGSVTFNQVGRELPMGGMNEAGLVVEMMWHFTAGYPGRDERSGAMELQWIQCLLDSCATVADAVNAIERVRIMPMGSLLHFHLLDRRGDEAIVEFINGKAQIYRGKDLSVKALTNQTYSECLALRSGFQGFGGAKPLHTTINDPDRFMALAVAVRLPGREKKLLDRAWAILEEVHCEVQESPTQWRFVYDPRNLEIHIRTLKNPELRTIRFKDLSFDCASGAKVLDLDAGAGDISRSFADYTPAFNEALMRRTFAIYKENGFQKDMPDFYVAVLAAYPDSLKCQ